MTTSSRTGLVGHLLRVGIAIIVAVAIFEAVCDERISLPPTRPIPSLPVHRGEYQEYVTPFGDTRTRTWEWRNDQFGMRYGTDQRDIEPGTSVAIVGDSFSWGAESDYPVTLEPRLQEQLPGVRVLNFSLCGSSTAEYPGIVAWYMQRVSPAGLKALVVGVYTDLEIGDIPRWTARERYGPRLPYHEVDVSASEADYLAHSWLYRTRFDAQLWLRVHSSTFNVLVPPAPSPYFATSLADGPTEKEFTHLAASLVSRLLATSAAASLTPHQTIVWLVPSNHVLHAQYQAQRQHSALSQFYTRSLDFWDYARREMQKSGFTVLDLRPVLNDAFLNGGPYPYTVSGHFLGASYGPVAEKLAPVVKQAMGYE
jgi:hypothetical protein